MWSVGCLAVMLLNCRQPLSSDPSEYCSGRTNTRIEVENTKIIAESSLNYEMDCYALEQRNIAAVHCGKLINSELFTVDLALLPVLAHLYLFNFSSFTVQIC